MATIVQTSEEDAALTVVRFASELAWADAGPEAAEPQVNRLCVEAQECMVMGRWLDLASLMLTSADLIFSKVSEKGETKGLKMGRGVSSGGGQSSLGYLFGSGEPANNMQTSQKPNGSSQPTSSTLQPTDKQIPAGIPGSRTNNYYRADGQNCGNFITDRPSTKVHAAPGGGSSLDFLFGNGRS